MTTSFPIRVAFALPRYNVKLPLTSPNTFISFESALLAVIDVCSSSDLISPARFNALYASDEITVSGKLFPESMIACIDRIPEFFDFSFILIQLFESPLCGDALFMEYDIFESGGSSEGSDATAGGSTKDRVMLPYSDGPGGSYVCGSGDVGSVAAEGFNDGRVVPSGLPHSTLKLIVVLVTRMVIPVEILLVTQIRLAFVI